MVKRKLITIESPGKLSVLGGLLGPITTPSYFDIDVIISLINTGKIVYEVNPINLKEKVRLNRLNVLKNNFTSNTKIVKPVDVVKTRDVGLSPSHVEPSTVRTTIVPETGESVIGVDVFASNMHS